ncbi:MAG: hypothetical protein MUF53_12780 [Gemmatimonadaceae bacterium]|jgi:hypothetical protein|nr:hypothetical protein [Gemmatimonadaceae bacterium]
MSHRNQIHGSTYDTDLAEFVAAASTLDEGGEGTETGLYLSHDGRWFLVVHPTERPSGAVVPLTAQQARAWCVQHDVDTDLVAQWFALPPDAGGQVDDADVDLDTPLELFAADDDGDHDDDDRVVIDPDLGMHGGYVSSRFDN